MSSMIRIFKLVLLLVCSQVVFGQAPSNYTNINGRYRWIAGMFDSTFHIPKGSTPSLRTGGSTNAGGLFYNTSDSSVYTYTGTQWIKVRGSITPSDTTNKYVTQVYKKNGSDSVFYVKGGNHLFAFVDSVGSPGGGGGGKIYYFNGGVNMGTIGGFTMYELGDTANTGAAANFTRATTGNIANFITDPNKPGLLQIPAGVWTVDAWLSETGGGANHAQIYVKVEKWDGAIITTIATSPIEEITEGNTPNLYTWSVTIPTTTLAVTDRIIIQFYIQNTNGKTVTLYTQNGYVGEVHTTFTTGIGAINGLTAPAQYLTTGTSGTDFNINSATATHTFNLPTASATNRGALSTADWTTFNNKVGGSGTANYVTKWTGTNTTGNSIIQDDGTNVAIGSSPSFYKFTVTGMTSKLNSGLALGIDQGGGALTGDVYFAGVNNGIKFRHIGSMGFEANLVARSTISANRAYTLPDSSGTVALLSNITGAINGTTNYISKFTSSSAIGNSQIFDNGTNVGINDTSPQYRFDVSGDLGVNGYINIGTTPPIKSTSGTDIAIGGSSDVTNIYYELASALLGSGGLGRLALPRALTTTRTYTLQNASGTLAFTSDIPTVSGTTNYIPKFTSSSAIGNSNLQTDASGNLGLGVTPSAWSPTLAKAIQIGNLGSSIWSYTTLNTSTPYTFIDNNAYEDGTNNIYIVNNRGAARYVQVNNVHQWHIAPSGTAGNPITFTQAMTLDASGNLGVGTTSPLYRLQVSGTSTSLIKMSNISANRGIIFGIDGSSEPSIQAVVDNTDVARQLSINPSGGNVGIGTTSPGTTLDVNGLTTIRAMSGSAIAISGDETLNSNFGITWNTPTYTGGLAAIRVARRGATDASDMMFFTAPNGDIPNERMRITSGGELLINTTSDAGDYKLQVNGNTYGVGNYYMNFSQDALTRLHIRNINTGSAAYVETTFETANGSGAVGKLGPNISYKTSSANSTFLYNGATYGDISILNDNATGKIVMATGGSSTAQFTLTSSGNVETTGSIKTAAPSGGTAKPFKIGAAATVTPTSPNRTIEIEIDGVTYYLTAKTTND